MCGLSWPINVDIPKTNEVYKEPKPKPSGELA